MVGIDAWRTNGDSSLENWVFTCHRFASGIFFNSFPFNLDIHNEWRTYRCFSFFVVFVLRSVYGRGESRTELRSPGNESMCRIRQHHKLLESVGKQLFNFIAQDEDRQNKKSTTFRRVYRKSRLNRNKNKGTNTLPLENQKQHKKGAHPKFGGTRSLVGVQKKSLWTCCS